MNQGESRDVAWSLRKPSFGNTFVGIEECRYGWFAFTKYTEAGYFDTKEDAEMALLKIMLSEHDI